MRTVLKDIWDIRQAKLRMGVTSFIQVTFFITSSMTSFNTPSSPPSITFFITSFTQSGELHAKLNHLQLIELNNVRPLLPHAFDQIQRLEMATAQARRVTQSSNSSSRSFLSH